MVRVMHLTPELQVHLAAAVRGERPALDGLVGAWLPVVVGWCRRLGGPSVDPEDAAHDVMMVVARRIETVYHEDRFPSWLFGITRRTLSRHRRRAFVARWVPGFAVDVADPADGPARLYAVSETSRQVQGILERMNHEDREVLVLALLEDRPDTEVAMMLELPLGTMKSRLRRARDRFLKHARANNLSPGGEAS
jgi:RNA polymerase sigma-70 factor, ECF subfamily